MAQSQLTSSQCMMTSIQLLHLLCITILGVAIVDAAVLKRDISVSNVDPTPVIIEKAGYPVEIHTVVTTDGYILEMHRIPSCKVNRTAGHGGAGDSSNRDGRMNRPAPVAFLQHGLMGSSVDWVLTGSEKGLGFILADAGYDVWMGNFRGSTYSRAHIHLDPDHFDFWKFSWDQMAEFDLPEMLTYAMTYTGDDKIFYVGFSMGTTAFIAMAQSHPHIQDHIVLANLLAPVVYVDKIKGALSLLAGHDKKMQAFADKYEWGEFQPKIEALDWIARHVCGKGELEGKMCGSIYFLMTGFDSPQLNASLVDTMIEHHNPAGASTYTILQYAQEIRSGNGSGGGFHAFDYGEKDKNMAAYGTEYPPEYDVTKVTAPIALYYGKNDWLAPPEGVKRLIPQVQNLVMEYEVPYAKFNHMDFQYAIDVVPMLYNELLKQMEIKRNEIFKI